MNSAAGEARKTAAPIISSGVPKRRWGVFVIPHAMTDSSDHNFFVRSVSTKPGAIQLTRTPDGPNSKARDRVICAIPAFDIA